MDQKQCDPEKVQRLKQLADAAQRIQQKAKQMLDACFPPSSAKPTSRMSKPVAIGIVAVVVLALLAILWFVVSGNSVGQAIHYDANTPGKSGIGFEDMIEGKLKLTINRDKTKIVKLKEEGERLNFLGYSFRFDRDLKGRRQKYLNMFPADKSVAGIKEKIKGKTERASQTSLTDVIIEMNKMTKGWVNYFKLGYPRMAFRGINYYMLTRFYRFTKNRSQRRLKPRRPGESLYTCLKRRGLCFL